ncbi:HK97-gp10 family putative phage morphogenesis protein [Salibacterium lacus]|uniref:HK97-gp10 family putative phage morphogenesis protein n=1 Tax=Salibacterium lacus TaxID=1898109 RepID=A0ABW5SWF0_9BACI
MKVEVEGLEKTMKKLDDWAAAKQKGIKDNVSSTAKLVEASQKSKVAVRSGDLKDSIGIVEEDNGFTTKVGPKNPVGKRAHFTELGTVNHGATPFIRPSAEMNKAQFVAGLTKELNTP